MKRTFQELQYDYFKNRNRRLVGYKTWLVNDTDTIKLIHHETCILSITRNNEFTLNNGGWYSKTTKDRLNWFSPVPVYTRQGNWSIDETLCDVNGNPKCTTRTGYYNGITVE